MIDRSHDLAVTRQARALGISRGSVYYLPKPASMVELEIMRRMDELHLEYPFAGSRMLRDLLRQEGFVIGRLRVASLMKRMAIDAIYRRPNTSKSAPGHKVYPYLLRKLAITRPNQVWATDISYIPMARGFVYLVAIVDWFSRKVLAWRVSISMDVSFCIEALEEALARYGKPEMLTTYGRRLRLQYRSGQSVHEHRLHQRAAALGNSDQHGWPRGLARQCHSRASVAFGQIRGGLPARLRCGQRSQGVDWSVFRILQRQETPFEPGCQNARSNVF